MAKQISKLAVILSATAAPFSNTLKFARKQLGDFQSAASSLKGIVIGGLSLVGLTASLGALKQMTVEIIDATHANWQLASSLGVSNDWLMAMKATASDAGVEDFSTIIEKLTKQLGEASANGGPAADALKKLNISANDLAGASLDEIFGQVADGIKEIHSPTERAIVLTDLFGKSGQKLAPMFANGAEGLREAQAEAVKIGQALTDIDAAKLETAWQQMDQVGDRIEGLKNKVVVGLAPVVDAISMKILEILPSADAVTEKVSSGSRYMAKALAYVGDFVHSLGIIWKTLKVVVMGVVDGILGSLRALVEGIAFVADKMGAGFDVSGFSDTVAAFHDDTVAAWEDLKTTVGEKFPSEGIDATFDEIDAKIKGAEKAVLDSKPRITAALGDSFEGAKDKITATLADLQKQIDTFGLSEGDKKVFDISKQIDTTKQEISGLAGAMVVALSTGDFSKALRITDQLESKQIALKVQVEGLDKAKELGATIDKLNRDAKIDDALKGIKGDLADIGKTDIEKKLRAFNELSPNASQLAAYKELLGSIEKATALQADMAEGKSIFEQTRTPLEKYQADIDKLNRLLAEGAINQETFGRASSSALDEMRSSADRAAESLGTIKAGSAELQKFSFDAKAKQRRDAGLEQYAANHAPPPPPAKNGQTKEAQQQEKEIALSQRIADLTATVVGLLGQIKSNTGNAVTLGVATLS